MASVIELLGSLIDTFAILKSPKDDHEPSKNITGYHKEMYSRNYRLMLLIGGYIRQNKKTKLNVPEDIVFLLGLTFLTGPGTVYNDISDLRLHGAISGKLHSMSHNLKFAMQRDRAHWALMKHWETTTDDLKRQVKIKFHYGLSRNLQSKASNLAFRIIRDQVKRHLALRLSSSITRDDLKNRGIFIENKTKLHSGLSRNLHSIVSNLVFAMQRDKVKTALKLKLSSKMTRDDLKNRGILFEDRKRWVLYKSIWRFNYTQKSYAGHCDTWDQTDRIDKSYNLSDNEVKYFRLLLIQGYIRLYVIKSGSIPNDLIILIDLMKMQYTLSL